MSTMTNDYELAQTLLSFFNQDSPVSLKLLANKVGVPYSVLMRVIRVLIHNGVIERKLDDEIQYALRTAEYNDILEKAFGNGSAVPQSSPQRTVARPGQPKPSDPSQASSSATFMSEPRITSMPGAVVRRRAVSPTQSTAQPSSPAPETSMPFTPTRNSSMELPYIDRKTSQQMTAKAIPSRDIPVSGTFKRVTHAATGTTSGLHKSVFVNNNAKSPASSLSSFSAMPFQPGNDLHRTDTNFDLIPVNELPQKNTPILAYHTSSATRTEYTEEMVRTLLVECYRKALFTDQVRSDRFKEIFERYSNPDPENTEKPHLFAIDCDTPTFELWSTFSAVANSGGGFILLGVRKHGISYILKKDPQILDKFKTLQKELADRTIISDASKLPESLCICSEGKSKKQFISILIIPETFDRLPVFTKMDSFGSKKDGCYCVKNGEVTRCTEDETKELWQQFYLLEHQPDWTQTGELLNVEMSRKLKLREIEDDEKENTCLTMSQIAHAEAKREKPAVPVTLTIVNEDGDSEEILAQANTPASPIQTFDTFNPRKAAKLASSESSANNKRTNTTPGKGAFSMQYTQRPDRIEPAEIVAERRRNEEASRLKEGLIANSAENASPMLNSPNAAAQDGNKKRTAFSSVSNAAVTRTPDEQTNVSPSPISTNDAIKAAILFGSDIRGAKIKPSDLAAIRAKMPDVQSTLFDIPPSERMIKEAKAEKKALEKANKEAMNEAMRKAAYEEEASKAAERREQQAAKPVEETPVEEPTTKKSTKKSPAEKKEPKKRTKASEATQLELIAQNDPNIPPMLSDELRPLLDELAEPAIEFGRLPAVRLCAIAVKVLRVACLTVQELSDVLHRTPVSIRKNVIGALEGDPNLKSVGKYYYYAD